MISHLRIAGFALIDELELALGPGLTVITGETGAGKSILVEALGLLRGGRASAESIRAGADEARVEAVIELLRDSAIRDRLLRDGREVDGELLVRRSITRAGRGRVHLGGTLATASDLTATIGGLIDIASQHDQQTLTDPENQLAILDAFADNRTLLAEMAAAYEALQEARRDLEVFDADARTRAEREDLLRYQLSEIDAARVTSPEEEASLKIERERLRGAVKFEAAVTRGEEVLYSGEGAVAGTVSAVARELGLLAPLDPTLAPFVERLREAQSLVEDVARELGRYGQGIRSDPPRLAEIEDRLFLLARLMRKHGGTLADVIARGARMKADLEAMGSFDAQLAARHQAVEVAVSRASGAAAALSTSRKRAAVGLEEKVSQGLKELALGAAKLPISVEPKDNLGPAGADRVRFLFAPNPGEPPRPLARIASGGELSRVMLGMKQALARSDQVSTYVFDEVDTGVGGAVAETIGRKLKAIAGERQVIVITHLPQIAVFADAHLRVEKTVQADRTTVTIERLDERQRSAEIARMLSGATPTKQASAHADELLRRARGGPPAAKQTPAKSVSS
jgi:DNA repair protein RecN (Recombination protein N)